MDFRTCPACRASVLDDDAEDCPFCGASMSGRPSARPAAAPAARTGSAPSAPASVPADGGGPATPKRPAATSQQRSGPSTTDSDDPFEVDTRAVVRAPQVSPKPAKGRMLRVVCPMCETPGFISPPLAGKDVKCCNPKCLMPIFTAPKPEAPPVVDEPSRRMAGTLFVASAVVLIGIVGAALYVFLLKDQGPTAPAPSSNLAGSELPGGETEASGTSTPPEKIEAPPPPPIPLSEVRETSLVEIEKAAQQRQNNRSKPYGRRLAAEAFAQLGLIDGAREQLEDMRRVQGYVPFYEVEPLVGIAASLQQRGDSAAAAAALEEALSKADFPQHGRESLSAACALATGLAAAGRTDEARRVALGVNAAGARGQIVVLWRSAIDSGTLDFDTPARRPYLANMPAAQWIAVTQSLCDQGHADQALQWAQSADDAAVRDNALAAWAAGVARADPSPTTVPPATVAGLLDSLTPAGQARVWAALADAVRGRGDAEATSRCLSRAAAALEQLPVSEPLMLPSLKAIYDSEGQPRAGLPDPADLRSAALAAIDLAQLHAEAGNTDAAAGFMRHAMAYLRGSAPSPAATQTLLDECERDRAGIESRLKSALGIEPGRLFYAFNRYRKQCGVLHEQATARFDLQVELLRRAAGFGLTQAAWEEAAARERESDPTRREPYFDTLLPGTVAVRAQVQRQPELAKQVQGALGGRALRTDPRDVLAVQFPAAVESGRYPRAADLLRVYQQQEPGDYYTSQLQVLRAVSRLIAAGRQESALELVQAVGDPLAREDAVLLIAAAAVRDGRHSDLWRRRSELGLSATEIASLYRGFVMGLALRGAETAPLAEVTGRRGEPQ